MHFSISGLQNTNLNFFLIVFSKRSGDSIIKLTYFHIFPLNEIKIKEVFFGQNRKLLLN